MDTSPPPLASRTKDEENLRLLSIFHYVVAAIGGVFACFPLFHVAMGVLMVTNPDFFNGRQGGPTPPPAVGYLFIAIGTVCVLIGWAAAIATFISGRCLARRRQRMFSFVVAAVLCVFFPIGTALGVFTIIVLSRESVQRLYEEA